MAAAADKNRCAICKKEKATLRCGGCSKDFCFNHVAEHRQELCKELDEVEVTRDLFRQALTEQASQSQNHPLMQRIDQWERESIDKIQQTANEARQLLVQQTTGNTIEIESQLNKLTDELRKSREEDDFFETDLSRWQREIARLNEALNKPATVSVRQNATSLVTKLVIDVGTNEKTIPKDEQPMLQMHAKLREGKRNTARKNNNKQLLESVITDDDHDNHSTTHHSIPVTRSLFSLPKLRNTFEDSGDDHTGHYFWGKPDMTEYRSNYPNVRAIPTMTNNFNFYTNQIPSRPHGISIDAIHRQWFGDYEKLEYDDGYMEWLFPLQEKGLNRFVEPLQKHEIEAITKNPEALKRILRSFELMLDFYGFDLVDENTGKIRRSPGNGYKERFRNLNTSPHNYLHITRILKSLGEFNYEYLKFPFLAAILQECITENTLGNCLAPCEDYWIETLRSQEERRAIRRYARELIEYRNKGIQPPKSHHAGRPASTRPMERMAISDDDEDDD